ncbi:MAG TPA: YbgA family protein, partial [Anaeromyxobacter sp.]|nr:YbgA family protein [Anaeromyxobacter sp.]
RWRRARPGRMTRGGLVAFHAAHELLLRAHGPAACRRLDRLVAGAGAGPLGPVLEAYGAGLMTVLRTPATRGRHAAVLRHVAGHLRGLLADGAREELEEAIGEYARGRVPLIVPQALLLRHARRHRVACLAGQVYLDPDPRERALRSGG